MITSNQKIFETMAKGALTPLLAHCAITGYPCPPWLRTGYISLEEPTTERAATAPATLRPGANGAAPGGQGSFEEAVLAAIKSSPVGLALAELERQPSVAAYKKPNNQIALAAGRLVKKNLVQKRGQLWLIKTTTVDKTIGQRRTRRARRAAKAAAGTAAAGNGAEQAAGAGN